MVLLAVAPAFSDAVLDAAKKTFEESDAKISADLAGGREGLLKAYEKALAKIMADFKAEGSLDKYLAAQKEVTRFEFDRSVPETNPPDLVAPLVSLRERFHTASRRDEADGLDRRLSLAEQYETYLHRQVKSLVTAGKIEEAQAVDAEIKRVVPVREGCQARRRALAALLPAPPAAAAAASRTPVAAPPVPIGTSAVLKSLVQACKGEVVEVDFDKGSKRNVKLDPLSGGYLFDGGGSYLRLDRDLPRKIGREDFTLVFDFRPEKRQHPTAYIVEHHRGAPWTGLMVCIEANNMLRLRLKDSPACQVLGDIRGILGDGKYHHVALNRQGHSLRVFLDGKTLASADTPEVVNLDIDYAGNVATVGTHCELPPDTGFAGGLKNMAIFIGDCLSIRDIQRLAN